MIQAVIGASIIYYLDLEWWWWVLLIIAIIVDISEMGSTNINAARTVDKLVSIEYAMKNIYTELKKFPTNMHGNKSN